MHLEVLNLAENLLNILPESLGQLVSLKMLSLNHNNLMRIPESICELSQLEI